MKMTPIVWALTFAVQSVPELFSSLKSSPFFPFPVRLFISHTFILILCTIYCHYVMNMVDYDEYETLFVEE